LAAPERIIALPTRPATDALRPSEYSATLIQALRADAACARDADVLEIGSGSGIVLAVLAAMGAKSVCGIDIEKEAVQAGETLLAELGHSGTFHCGDMWQPVTGRRFDLIAANLPHFPMGKIAIGDRRPSWSSGGADGRDLLDPFLAGLSRHLAPGGRAVITHNAFVDLERSREIAGRQGLDLRIVSTSLVYISREKLGRMCNNVLRREEGRTIHRYGPYAFADMHIVELAGMRPAHDRR